LAHFHCATSAVISQVKIWAKYRELSGASIKRTGTRGPSGCLRAISDSETICERYKTNRAWHVSFLDYCARVRARLRICTTFMSRSARLSLAEAYNTRNVPGMTIYGYYRRLYYHTCKWMYLAYARGNHPIPLAPTSAPRRAPVARGFLGEARVESLLAQFCGCSTFRMISDAAFNLF